MGLYFFIREKFHRFPVLGNVLFSLSFIWLIIIALEQICIIRGRMAWGRYSGGVGLFACLIGRRGGSEGVRVSQPF
jgi:hypothetical protein